MNKIGVILAGLLLACAAGPVLGAVKTYTGATPALGVQDQIIVRGGVIRLGKSLYIHENSSHAAVGLTKVELVDKCQLRVYTDWVLGEAIMAAIAEEDETLARLGVQAGVSGGGPWANISLYRNGKKVCANSSIFGAAGNIWLQLTYRKVPG